MTINLAASANYVLTNLARATAVILDRPINNWLRANFSTAELAQPLISGDSANPDLDGLPNLMEYALGTSPRLLDGNQFVPSTSNGVFTVTYPLSKSAVDVSLTPEWSTNLVTWLTGTNYFKVVNIEDQMTNQIITIQPVSPAASGFFRFRVTRQ